MTENTQYEMVAAIAGDVLLDMDAIEGLLDWILPDDSFVLLSNAVNPGIQRVMAWMLAVDQDFAINSGHDRTLVEHLYNYGDPAVGGSDDTELALIVLDVEGNEALIHQAWDRGIDVYDLTRALFPVDRDMNLEDILYEPETHAHELADGLGGRSSLDIFASQEPAQSRTEAFPRNGIFGMEHTEKELLDIVAGMIRTHEEKYHAPKVQEIEGVAINVLRDLSSTASGPEEGSDEWKAQRIRCIVSKGGSIRQSPRAKAKPGEREIWLLPDEIDE